MPGTFSSASRVGDPNMYHGIWVTHVPSCLLGSLTSRFLWIRWRGKRSRHSRRMGNPQFNLSGKLPLESRLWHVPLITGDWGFIKTMLALTEINQFVTTSIPCRQIENFVELGNIKSQNCKSYKYNPDTFPCAFPRNSLQCRFTYFHGEH